ncbi:MAG: biopolymer transporter ExbD [Phycisphaeraceae bacterium]|nr:biopolymer transporter ExbD [Phycisphaeraceae bacterium]MCW5763301.1 biopolymer transporter ExbD [Phycisphaeraceae bacterium]
MRFSTVDRTKFRTFDLTPMIDVVLQLIIFFMFTSQLGRITQTEVDLPLEPGEKQITQAPPSFVLDLLEDGELILEGRPISLAQFSRLVDLEISRAGGPEHVTILIRPDRLAPAKHLSDLALRLREQGVGKWQIGTTDPLGAR